MNRHLTSELLSAYVDSELGLEEMVRVEAHCRGCATCRSRLTALRQVSRDVASLGSIVPPASLRAQIRLQIAAQPRSWKGRWLARMRWLFEVPSQPAFRHGAAVLFVAVFGTFLFSQMGDRTQRAAEGGVAQESVETFAGDPPLGAVQMTTGEVDGLKFVWTEGAGWVQKGLEGERPQTSVDETSPQGRELLRRYADLEVLLADGDSVVLRYNLETVEIRAARSGEELPAGALARPRVRVRAALDLTSRVV